MRWRPNVVRSLGWDPRHHEESRNCSGRILLFCISRKVVLETFSELDEIKTEVIIFLLRRRSPKGRRRRARSGPHHTAARAPPWPRQGVVWAHQAPALDRFRETLTLPSDYK